MLCKVILGTLALRARDNSEYALGLGADCLLKKNMNYRFQNDHDFSVFC